MTEPSLIPEEEHTRYPAVAGYWLQASVSRSPFSSLPGDTAAVRSAEAPRSGHRYAVPTAAETAARIADLCRQDDFLAHCLFTAAVAVTAARWTARHEAVLVVPPLIGLPASRTADGPPPGLALPVAVPRDLSLAALLTRVRQGLLAVYGRQLHVPRSAVHPAGAPGIAVHVPALHGPIPPAAVVILSTDLTGGRPGDLRVDADASLYTGDLPRAFAEACADVLAQMAADPGRDLTAVVEAAERAGGRPHSVVLGDRPTVPTESMAELFRRQAAMTPRHIALICGADRVTYEELDVRSDQFAAALADRGAGPGDLVGTVLDRGVEAVAAALGALKAGCGYVPLPPDQPSARIAAAIAATCPSAVLVDALAAPEAIPPETVVVRTADVGPGPGAVRPAALRGPLCVLYTSGSTGVPNSVAIGESAVLNRLYWMWRTQPFEPGESLVLTKSLGLVGSLWECFGGLLRGVPTTILTAHDLLDPGRLWDLLRACRVTRLHTTPAVLDMLLGEAGRRDGETLDSLKRVSSSAEPLAPATAARWRQQFPGHALVNLYGLTECASNVAVHEVGEAADTEARIPIGRPIDHVGLYVLDERRHPVPRGALGELHVGGRCVADGYLNRPQLTRDTFSPDPHFPADDARTSMFRTGDLARVRPDGTLEVIGRLDRQVKIRGFRVSLEEVEYTLGRHPQVAEAAAVDVGQREDARIVGHVVPRRAEPGRTPVGPQELRAHCAAMLPSYMVPAEFVMWSSLPRTRSGKVARSALPAPTATPIDGSLPPAHRAVLGALAGLLGRNVTTAERLDDLNMHSLRMVRLHRRLAAHFGDHVELLDLFRCATVGDLCSLTENGQGSTPGDDERFHRRAELRRRSLLAARPTMDRRR
ncbi:amino acid adenylation domain-containing protein [Streptomyces phaeochromogenes]|uniref:non-ribosomal peptide synthetase n=1 Tax=Streptomyces phaeochromogenes TaxID=1923 RepID=UPI0033EF8018